MLLSKPKSGDYVLIDTSFFLLIHEFPDECLSILKELQDVGVKLSMSQIVKVELLKHSLDVTVYKTIEELISKQFYLFSIDEWVLQSACILNALYYWNPVTKSRIQKKDILNDLITGTLAAHIEREKKVPAYVLAEDGDFMSPYFADEECYGFFDRKQKMKHYVHLYKPNRDQANADWAEFEKMNEECKRSKTMELIDHFKKFLLGKVG